jgi:hypothetical protein
MSTVETEPKGSTSSSPDECVEASHCFEHAERCCHCGKLKDTLPRGGAEGSKDEGPMCHCGHVANDHDSHGLAGDTCHGCDCKALRTGPHEHEWGEWKPDRLMRIEYATCYCGASKARRAEPEKCYCGCAPGAHMGKPTGCLKHSFHEFIRASFVPGADPDAPACVTCEHAQGAHPEGGHCVGWTADGAKCGCDGYEPEKPRELCGSCDAGLPMSCTCPEAVPDWCDICRQDRPCSCDEEPAVPVCTHCQGPHALEDCKGLEEPDAPRCCSCGSADVVYRNYREQPFCEHCSNCTCGHVPCERKPAPPPRRPPYAVAYAVEGGAQYEVAVSGDATVVAEDGALMVLHPKKPVLAIVRVTPMNMEES